MNENQIRLKVYLSIFIVLLAVGVTGFMTLEDYSLTDAVYFSIVTMATVGYGDLHPQTEGGKLLALLIIIGGVGTFLGVAASFTDWAVNRRTEKRRRQKLDMVTGLFFSEMGNELLRRLAGFDPEPAPLRARLAVSTQWKRADFVAARRDLESHRPAIDARLGDMAALRAFLLDHAGLLLRLLESPMIQEHERFTDLLRAIFHLRDELLHRSAADINAVGTGSWPEADRTHLQGDMVRIYRLLIFEWLRYLRYLEGSYVYLFSLAVRTNPFDPEAEVVFKDDPPGPGAA